MDSEKQNKMDVPYLQMAFICGENSRAVCDKVGCLIVKSDSILAHGHNETTNVFPRVGEDLVCTLPDDYTCPNGGVDCHLCEYSQQMTSNGFLHAEENAITKLSESNNSGEVATMYVTDEPCVECSELIAQSGIKRVVYARERHSHGGIQLLNKAGIEVQQIHINN